MNDDAMAPRSLKDRWSPLLRRADQVTIATLVITFLVAITAHWVYQATVGDGLIEIDRATPLEANFEVRVNEADWPELTLLPGIGETLARRIVTDRRENGPFRSVEQLQRVKGIGPKTVRRVRRFVAIDASGGHLRQ